MSEKDINLSKKEKVEEKLKQLEMLVSEARTIREKDKKKFKLLTENFYDKKLNVGIAFQRAYGAIFSGDYFDLIQLPDGNYMVVFADISGHGLPAYTTLLRLRSAITICISEVKEMFGETDVVDTDLLVRNINIKFTDIMDDANSYDFASVSFTFIKNEGDMFHLKFYNQSMLFPIVFRKFENEVIGVYDLNNEMDEWSPKKGYLLGSDVRKLLKEKYLETPPVEFTVYEGDAILFYSDGIIEAYNKDVDHEEYGEERMIKYLKDHLDLAPELIVQLLFENVYEFLGSHEQQRDDMTAVLIDFPNVRN